jgi:murein DD-endopeptidase MepM/ murein hydrolase activator NlpD
MLVVIVIAALTGLALQSDNRPAKVVAPVIRYVMRDYGVQEKIALYLENIWGKGSGEGAPASGDIIMQKPCDISVVKQHYGWYWNDSLQKQEFNPGMVMQVENGTLVKPILAGKVERISDQAGGRQVTVTHHDGLVSVYGGLQEVLIKEGGAVQPDQVLGKSGEELYFELQNTDGPLNPESIFAGN